MPRRVVLVLLSAMLFSGPTPLGAQEPEFREELRFVEKLRQRGDNDLALKYLQRIAKGASPELARELPLEFAKTRLRVAGDEPDTNKRLALYKTARGDLQKFIDTNPRHPRASEANVDIARVLNLQGKTELSRALLNEDPKGKQNDAKLARTTLEEAGKRLAAAAKSLEGQLTNMKEPGADAGPAAKKQFLQQRRRVEEEQKQTQFEGALNLYDRSQTFIGGVGDEEASKLLEDSRKALEVIASGDPRYSITWKARAWLGRVVFEVQTADKAREKFAEVIGAGERTAAAEGIRLARYFRLLVIRRAPSDAEKKDKRGIPAIIIDRAQGWRKDYPRHHKTPEGYGITFLLAQSYLERAAQPKLGKKVKEDYRARARRLLSELEGSENEYTDPARRLKIEIMAQQKVFSRKVSALKTFEDCFTRAQYEIIMMAKEAKDYTDYKKWQKKRKARIKTLMDALEAGLKKPGAKEKRAQRDANNARLTLAYWALVGGDYKKAIKVGEDFVDSDPRSSQAALAATYALEAYPRLLFAKKQAGDEDLDECRARMFRLARKMEERWGREPAGDKARHEIGWQLGREKNYPEAIKKLTNVTPSYPAYAQVQSLLASCCYEADKEKLEPIPGDRPGDYRRRALHALNSIPESALGPDPEINTVYLAGKIKQAQEWYRPRRFKDMEDLARNLLKRLPALRFAANAKENEARRADLHTQLVSLILYARYGQAEEAFSAGDHAKVLALLDPPEPGAYNVVNQVNKADTPERLSLAKNPRLGSSLLSFALRSNVQLLKTDRADAVMEALDRLAGEGEQGGDVNMLKLLAVLIKQQVEDLQKKGDKSALKKAREAYTALLGKRIKKLGKSKKEPPAEFMMVLADCYASMGEHPRAAGELAKVTLKEAKPGTREEILARVIQIKLVRELRLSGDKASLKKARVVMDKILGTKKKPGWGMRHPEALTENGVLLTAQKKYREGFAALARVVRGLGKRARTDERLKELYLEAAYYMIYCYFKDGQNKSTRAEREKALKGTAQKIIELEKSWEGYGSDASTKRFKALLREEESLKAKYRALKKGKGKKGK
jgi:hypothetical protein